MKGEREVPLKKKCTHIFQSWGRHRLWRWRGRQGGKIGPQLQLGRDSCWKKNKMQTKIWRHGSQILMGKTLPAPENLVSSLYFYPIHPLTKKVANQELSMKAASIESKSIHTHSHAYSQFFFPGGDFGISASCWGGQITMFYYSKAVILRKALKVPLNSTHCISTN